MVKRSDQKTRTNPDGVEPLVNVFLTRMAGGRVGGAVNCDNWWYPWYAALTDLLVLLHGVTFLVRSVSAGVPLTERCISIFATINCVQIQSLAVYQRVKRARFVETTALFSEVGNRKPELSRLIVQWTGVARAIPKVLFISECVAGAVWCALPALPLIQVFNGGRFLVGPAWFPFDPLKSPAFEAVVVFQILGAMLVSLKVTAFYDLLLNMGYRLVASYVHLRSTLPLSLPPDSSRSLDAFIQDHQKVIKLEQALQKVYSPALLMHFFFQLIIICTSVFVFVKAKMDLTQMIFSFLYVGTNTVKLFFICRMGDHLAFESDRLMEDAMGCEWYLTSKKIKNSLKIIISRTSRNFKISALGVFPLTSETFRSVIATAYSYYTFLDQIKIKPQINYVHN